MALSLDLRKRVISAIEKGERITSVARRFKVARKTVYNWLYKQKETNSFEAKTNYQKGHSHKITDLDKFREFVEKNKHETALIMIKKWKEKYKVTISPSAFSRYLKKINYTRKKKLWIHRS